MDDFSETIRQLLDAVPHRSPSKLEPHAAVIRELRKKRRTYTEIAQFLEQHLQLRVAPSTLHYFVNSRANQAREQKARERKLSEAAPVLAPEPVASTEPAPEEASTGDAVRDRIRALKNKPVPAAIEPARFAFNPDQPLTFQPKKTEE